MKEKTVIDGTFKGSRPPNRGLHNSNQMSIEELIAQIKFKRTIRRIIKLIKTKS